MFESEDIKNKNRVQQYDEILRKIDSLSKDPQEVFSSFGLPVDIVTIDSIEGEGRSKSLVFRGKSYKRPELIARDFYAKDSRKVTWTEGLVVQLLVSAFRLEIAFNLRDRFGIHPNSKKVIADFYDKGEERDSRLGLLHTKLLALHQGNEEEIREIEQVIHMAFGWHDEDEEWRSSKRKKFICLAKRDEMKREIIATFDRLVEERNIGKVSSWLPAYKVNENPSRGLHFFQNEWTLSFCNDVLENFDWQRLKENFLKMQLTSQTDFDLTIFDFASGEIIFREVKFTDTLTDFQKSDLARGIVLGLDVGLVQVRSP